MRLPGRFRLPETTPERRNLGMVVVMVVGLLVLGARLVQVQAVDAEKFKARGDAQSQREVELPSQRGRIYDRNGAVLATTVDRAAIFVDPSVFAGFEQDGQIDPDEEASRATVARELSRLLEVTRADVLAALAGTGPNDQFSYVARGVAWPLSDEVVALGLPGVHRLTEPTRTYPVGELAAPLLGFTNHENAGVAGLEMQYEDLLTGTPGHLQVEVDGRDGALGISSGDRQVTPSVPGEDLVVTIDRDIQATAQRVAEETMAANNADGVSIVAMDPRSGELLAVASTPGFDPMDVRDGDDWSARPFTDAVEPGSVQKAITMAIAWEAGLIDESTVIDVPATLTVGGKTWESHGLTARSMDIREILERSSNVGTMMVADLVGPQRLHDGLLTFGYGRPTNVGFPGESAGLLPDVDDWSSTSLPTIAIGHGVAVSTIQLASFYQVLANDGVRVQPNLVRGTVDGEGELVGADRPDTAEILSEDTARAVRDMLTSVVEGDHGTGERAAVAGYDVAGKTGTADKPLANGRGYSEQTTAVFAGMAPADDPEVVVVVMVDEPDTRFGGTAAAPAFSEVMAHALSTRNVVPTAAQPTIDEAIDDANTAAAAAEARKRAAAAKAAAEAKAAAAAKVAAEAAAAATAEATTGAGGG